MFLFFLVVRFFWFSDCFLFLVCHCGFFLVSGFWLPIFAFFFGPGVLVPCYFFFLDFGSWFGFGFGFGFELTLEFGFGLVLVWLGLG